MTHLTLETQSSLSEVSIAPPPTYLNQVQTAAQKRFLKSAFEVCKVSSYQAQWCQVEDVESMTFLSNEGVKEAAGIM